MPYGTKDSSKDSNTNVRYGYYGTATGTPQNITVSKAGTTVDTITTSGTNRNSGAIKQARRRRFQGYTFVEKEVSKRVKTTIHVKVGKTTKRIYKYVTLKRIILVRKKKYRSYLVKPNDLLPNDLTVTKTKQSVVLSPLYGSKYQSYGGNNYLIFFREFIGDNVNFTGVPWHSSKGLVNAYYRPNNYTANSSAVRWAPLVAIQDSVAANGLREKIRNMSFNAAQALAERQQTAGMLADLSKTAVKAIKELKRGRVKAASNMLFPLNTKETANAITCWEYGIRPLLSDIDSAAKILAESMSALEDLTATRSVTQTYTEKTDLSAATLRSNGGGAVPCTAGYIERIATITVKYKSNYSLLDEYGRLAAELGFTNPAELAWELVPFSFVIDHFLPIGNFLSSMDSGFNAMPAWTTKTVFIKESVTFHATVSGKDSELYDWGSGSIVWKSENVYCTRTMSSALPDSIIPRFSSNPPSIRHLVDYLALLRQRF